MLAAACGSSGTPNRDAGASANSPVTTVQTTTAAAPTSTVQTTAGVAPSTTAAPTTTVAPSTSSRSGLAPVPASANVSLCKLRDGRGVTRWVYQEPMVEGAEYGLGITDPVNNIVYRWPNRATGFPNPLSKWPTAVPPEMWPSEGVVTVAFIAVDFPDVQGDEGQLDEVRAIASEVAQYFSVVSGGRVKVEFVFGDRVFRVDQASGTYGLQTSPHPARELVIDIVASADPHVDFSGVDTLNVLPPSGIWEIANGFHWPHAPGRQGTDGGSDGASVMTSEGPIHSWQGSGEYHYRPNNDAWAMFAHMFLHSFGIHDTYRYGVWDTSQRMASQEMNMNMGHWGIQSSQDGGSQTLIAWHRWLLGWLGEDQVYCLPAEQLTEAEMSLTPLERSASGYKAVMIPLSEHKVIVVESRRAEGYDTKIGNIGVGEVIDGVTKRTWISSRGANGLVVYTYDTSVQDGQGQALMQIPAGRPGHGVVSCPIINCLGPDEDLNNPRLRWDPNDDSAILINAWYDPILRLGDSITVEGVTIELVESGESDRVRISR